MARRALARVGAIAFLLALAGCGGYLYFGYGYDYDDCWYDDYGNYWCDDGYYASSVWTTASVDPVASHDVLRLVNEERSAEGLEPLALDARLSREACVEAGALADAGSVPGPAIPEGPSLADRLDDLGIEAPRWTLVVDEEAVRPEDVVARWMADRVARAAILDPERREAGVGVHATEKSTCWAALFVGP